MNERGQKTNGSDNSRYNRHPTANRSRRSDRRNEPHANASTRGDASTSNEAKAMQQQSRSGHFARNRNGARRGNWFRSNRGAFQPQSRSKADRSSNWREEQSDELFRDQNENEAFYEENKSLESSTAIGTVYAASAIAASETVSHSNHSNSVSQFKRRMFTNKRSVIVVKESEENDENQRELLAEQLRNSEYECMVCCEEVKLNDAIWSCAFCYNMFHLNCIKTWALSNGSVESNQQGQSGWRCPVCQHIEKRIPTRYYCFCGKIKNPEFNPYLVPHSCGNVCRKKKVSSNRVKCDHNCTIQCHPGPCPPCQVKISKYCCCGKSMFRVNCESQSKEITCGKQCDNILNCGIHRCTLTCHSGPCANCNRFILQRCFCGKESKTAPCAPESIDHLDYSCSNVCGKILDCKNHFCEKLCHPGECDPCSNSPAYLTHCHCGKKPLSELTKIERKSCTDPIPSCGLICGKALDCGPKENPHTCIYKCHEGKCSPCKLKTIIRCKCGANSESIDCRELSNTYKEGFFTCKRRCNKKLSCSRHKCLVECCTKDDHNCNQVCGKKLSCNLHTCEDVCHKGSCPPCWNVSWEDLTCRCGSSVIYPPIACGTKPPECNQPCSRPHPCNHRVLHNCHNEESCPPCTEFVTKLCYGAHEERQYVPCYSDGVSCGKTCLKSLACGIHNCQRVCHFGDCGSCNLPCSFIRPDCGHPCSLPCHQSATKSCPKSECKVMLQIHCSCGVKTDQAPCYKVNDDSNRKIPLTLLTSIQRQNSDSMDVTELLNKAKENKLCQLECDERCSLIERNRRLAEALNINDADLSPEPGPPNYSDTLKQSARENPTFMNNIYESLTNLVKEAKQSKLNFKNLNFPAMRSDHRQVIHELCEFFGCKSHAVDREPHRSVVVKAHKDKCYLPTLSVMEVVKLEDEKRNSKNPKKVVPEKKSENSKAETISKDAKKNVPEQVIDYFDFVGN
ncbi:Protein shuttle craft-like protein [Dinothrombium tinctorium]|uniref:Protein shuttle craft-like protein n=1 Tax=Dinothrombium tinctorium TaxID=1965070 RepID=A0A3S3RMN9_9ACAR|nr:Protein shuttle craft-like protein [Dinothrombium tinctorium]RWS03288.1 Protein shuttle craft-like protein [Dinothrombium tinctorium]RWS03589.1 Protein shuttle craft-like protein [Dinothrombium tinctorium]RWS03594.1 Protein shuttle craft-like protein [Dinothrombium tinctorium]